MVRLRSRWGRAEDFFKKLKGGFDMEWTSCAESYADAVFLRLGDCS